MRRISGQPGARARWLCLLALLVGLSTSCRDTTSEEAPIHLNPNMDNQAYLEAQEANNIVVGGKAVADDFRGMRLPPAGTVAAPNIAEPDTAQKQVERFQDAHYLNGTINEKWADGLPEGMELTERLVQRGKERYEIYCTPCHGMDGSGNGIVVSRGMTRPPTYHDQERRSFEVGRLFNIISNGGDLMPSFKAQIPVDDRWAITTYIRALQHSQNVALSEVPEDKKAEVKKQWEAQ